jgi:pantoate--beta-alanine ligase
VREIESIEWLRAAVSTLPDPIGVVPLTFDLHVGHLSLLRHARAENATVVASLFSSVGGSTDPPMRSRYPLDPDCDRALVRECGVDLLVNAGHFPPQPGARVVVPGLSHRWYGVFNQGFFESAATVNLAMCIAARASRIYVGDKDHQLAVVTRRAAAALLPWLEVKICPTIREADGLPVSSSNARLSAEEREAAGASYRALGRAQALLDAGERRAAVLQAAMMVEILASRLLIDYAVVVDPERLEPVQSVEGAVVGLVSARIGTVRLTDSMVLALPE